MRGKAHGCHLFPPLFRITPAYAGKRLCMAAERNFQQDHPRLCGEKGFIKNETMIWGRITPAYAGKSVQLRQYQGSSRDHPRLCGEKYHGNFSERR